MRSPRPCASCEGEEAGEVGVGRWSPRLALVALCLLAGDGSPDPWWPTERAETLGPSICRARVRLLCRDAGSETTGTAKDFEEGDEEVESESRPEREEDERGMGDAVGVAASSFWEVDREKKDDVEGDGECRDPFLFGSLGLPPPFDPGPGPVTAP